LSAQFEIADVAKATLVAFLKANTTGLTVIDEWPYGNQKIAMPSATISTTKPKRMPAMPVQISVTEPDINGQVVANEYVADWDDVFQIDLWCRNKVERTSFTSQILGLFNSQELNPEGVDGLSLQMTTYFNEWCRYEIDTVECVDDAAAAERQERREKIMVLVNCREIVQRTYYAIKTLTVFNQATDQESALTDDTTGTDENTIF
jgi:hypothetical protein